MRVETKARHVVRVLAWSLLALAPALVLSQRQAVPQAEQMDVATLKPQYPHRLFSTMAPPFGGTGFEILDGDTLEIEGSIPAERGELALDPGGRNFYVCETIWTLGNRGTRQDMISVYDSVTLNLTNEIPLPGRLIVGTRTHNCEISASGKFAYTYNMQPASSVIVVDLAQRRVASTIEIPGCAAAFPWRDDGFASLCGDGSLATVELTGDGHSRRLSHSARFFNADSDPILGAGVFPLLYGIDLSRAARRAPDDREAVVTPDRRRPAGRRHRGAGAGVAPGRRPHDRLAQGEESALCADARGSALDATRVRNGGVGRGCDLAYAHQASAHA
jgi:hypothetical protein